jgi:hypothetical protein
MELCQDLKSLHLKTNSYEVSRNFFECSQKSGKIRQWAEEIVRWVTVTNAWRQGTADSALNGEI